MLGYRPLLMTGNVALFVSDRDHVSFTATGISDNKGEVCGNSSLKSLDSLGKSRWICGKVGHFCGVYMVGAKETPLMAKPCCIGMQGTNFVCQIFWKQ